MSTKAERRKIVEEKVKAERERILKVMNQADLYAITLDSLIES